MVGPVKFNTLKPPILGGFLARKYRDSICDSKANKKGLAEARPLYLSHSR